MKKKADNPAEAQGAGADETKKFRLDAIGFTDLEGRRTALIFDQREFGNMLFSNATSIEMDAVAKDIHKFGSAETTADVLRQLDAIVQQISNYNHRVKSAVSEYVNNLIGGK